jgi:hypothetical protein
VSEEIRNIYDIYPRLINEKKFEEISTNLDEMNLEETDDTILVCHLVSAHWCYIQVEEAYRRYYDRLRKYFEDAGENADSILAGLSPERCDAKYKTPSPEEKWMTGVGDALTGINIERGE